jgi:hypothetical protein
MIVWIPGDFITHDCRLEVKVIKVAEFLANLLHFESKVAGEKNKKYIKIYDSTADFVF